MGSNGDSELTVYRPDARLRDHPLRAVRKIAEEIWTYRWHISIAFLRDLRGIYRGTAFGAVWAVILPLVPIGVYWSLSAVRVFPVHEGIPPALYISIGITLWFALSGAIVRPIAVVETRGAEIARVHYPLIGAVMSGFAELVFDTVIRFAVIAPMYLFLLGMPPAATLAVIPLFVLALSGCLGLGLMLAIVNAIYRDVGKVTNILVRYAIFLSAALFPLPSTGPLHVVAQANPLYIVIDGLRELMVFGHLSNPMLLAVTILAGVAMFVAGCTVFYRLEYRIRGII